MTEEQIYELNNMQTDITSLKEILDYVREHDNPTKLVINGNYFCSVESKKYIIEILQELLIKLEDERNSYKLSK